MGETEITGAQNEESRRAYLRLLLRDIEALERMHEDDLLESGVRRIGAEQEVAIIDESGAPLPISDELLARLPGESFTTELGTTSRSTSNRCPSGGSRCVTSSSSCTGFSARCVRWRGIMKPWSCLPAFCPLSAKAISRSTT